MNINPKCPTNLPSISRIIFNDGVVTDAGEEVSRGATIVFFNDGTRTVVRRMEGDANNHETALLYALVKRIYGTTVNLKTGEVKCEGLSKQVSQAVAHGEVQPQKVIKAKKKEPARDKAGRFIRAKA